MKVVCTLPIIGPVEFELTDEPKPATGTTVGEQPAIELKPNIDAAYATLKQKFMILGDQLALALKSVAELEADYIAARDAFVKLDEELKS